MFTRLPDNRTQLYIATFKLSIVDIILLIREDHGRGKLLQSCVILTDPGLLYFNAFGLPLSDFFSRAHPLLPSSAIVSAQCEIYSRMRNELFSRWRRSREKREYLRHGSAFNIARAFFKIINLASSTFLESKLSAKSDRHNRNANKMQLVIPYFIIR